MKTLTTLAALLMATTSAFAAGDATETVLLRDCPLTQIDGSNAFFRSDVTLPQCQFLNAHAGNGPRPVAEEPEDEDEGDEEGGEEEDHGDEPPPSCKTARGC
ncbi:MAG: hypothetical protein MUE98_00310 [Rhodobacteraceae bacterium]|jgi:hypothetical protein|nr:hypothetical protein [Paracoccaceae bacterium]